ncbi:BTB/POZ domain-containing protein At1g21780 isoform X2 [Lotus japonicus]|uniref:BTB/POZ domain-containing protein At1g21780 isoform X2 n=1 Tax=Lotus japonicus TaxID=34305 RepID=UPI00258A22A1|nr:BTB/POZ domain-containing protein At1g21780 isoform X2 [Lotus japonicus]
MVDDRVDTIGRLAQWKVDNLGPSSCKKSEPFKVGLWNWCFLIIRNHHLFIHLYPEPSRASKENPPHARIVLRISNAGVGSSRKFHISPVQEKLIKTEDDFVWTVDTAPVGRFIIDVEFLDLKICTMKGEEASSIWPSDGNLLSVAAQSSSLHCLAHMFDEAIHADLTIITADGTFRAHKAVRSASSPVFQSMFHHDLKEKESSTIHIEDMSLESCKALISYFYGTIKQEDFWKHRLPLLAAANKYDIGGLKGCCEESLLEDLNSGNVLQMLSEAWFYQLHKLKKECMVFLFEFGKIYDVSGDEMNTFFQHADKELIVEMFQEMLTIPNPVKRKSVWMEDDCWS